ncbi:DNA cytosine methyltransferase [Pseudomonas putida]|uniref:DNA cytosine methyltransferase n=1 Tax=Pseudomonas putida TaxID=303 RepID=UPI0020C3B0FF|nr:DNA cytosine methyltransferase [Pseudomonas putida]UTL83623.1 DNA cytosine methyltransferase [Pseudomonas putida]
MWTRPTADQRSTTDDPGNSNTTRSLPAISLFSGAGGLDLGLENAGNGKIQFKAWVELDEDCRRTLALNHPGSDKAIFGDITMVTPEELMKAAGVKKGETFLVAGGPPCQAFSTAGLRRSINEERGQVVDHYFDVIRKTKPRFFVFENVRGLASVAIKHRLYVDRIASERANPGEPDLEDDERLGSVFDQVFWPKMKSLGYEIVFGLVNAADYGTAQIRHRLVFIGSRDKEFGSGTFRKITGETMTLKDLLPPTHHKFAPYLPIKPWRTLRDAIEGMPEPTIDQTFSYSDERREIWKRIPPGKYWTYIRDNPDMFPEGLENFLKGAFKSGGGKVGYWRRLAWDKQAPTLPTQPQHLATGLCHPEVERPLSVPEYAALQDFPASYKFAGNKASQYKQIGNAVPARLGRAVGNLLLSVAGFREATLTTDEIVSPKIENGC